MGSEPWRPLCPWPRDDDEASWEWARGSEREEVDLRGPWWAHEPHQAGSLGPTAPGARQAQCGHPSSSGSISVVVACPCGVTSGFLSLTNPVAPSLVGQWAQVRSCAGTQVLCLRAGALRGGECGCASFRGGFELNPSIYWQCDFGRVASSLGAAFITP